MCLLDIRRDAGNPRRLCNDRNDEGVREKEEKSVWGEKRDQPQVRCMHERESEREWVRV
jgi:hypothetical protein